MIANIAKLTNSQVFSKTYTNLTEVGYAARLIIDNPSITPQVTILGKIDDNNITIEKDWKKQAEFLRTYWKELFHESIDFGYFFNPNIGTIFAVGDLAAIFLYNMEGKSLGAMSGGPYGILRGLGFHQVDTIKHIKALETGNYILILRGTEMDIDCIAKVLDNSLKSIY